MRVERSNGLSGKKIKVLIVDDSAVVRQTLSEILESDPDISVMGVAADPYIAAETMESQIPDVITLDIEMPRMDGLTFLEKIMSQHPIPVVMCSSLADEGCATAMRAMECGAVTIISKPKMGIREFFEESRITICDAVKAAAAVKPQRLPMMQITTTQADGKTTIRIDGQLSIVDVASAKADLVAALASGREIELDLGEIGECDTAGVQLLLMVRASARSRGKTLTTPRQSAAFQASLERVGIPTGLFEETN